jgi:hypothetical protein
MQKIFADWSSKKTAADQQARESAAKKNSSEGEAFLKSHGKESGVTTLPSGIQYKVIKQGSGKSPTLEDSVVVHYRGSLLDGTEFDSSRKRGAPATFPVRGLIPGWTEVLQKMKEGDQWEVVIPPSWPMATRALAARSVPMPCCASTWSCCRSRAVSRVPLHPRPPHSERCAAFHSNRPEVPTAPSRRAVGGNLRRSSLPLRRSVV